MIKIADLRPHDYVVYTGPGRCLVRGSEHLVLTSDEGRLYIHCEDGEHFIFPTGAPSTSCFDMTPTSAFKRAVVSSMTPIDVVEYARQRCGWVAGVEFLRIARRFQKSLATLIDFNLRSTAIGFINDAYRLSYYMAWLSPRRETETRPYQWSAQRMYIAVETISNLAGFDAETKRHLHFSTDLAAVTEFEPPLFELEKIFAD